MAIRLPLLLVFLLGCGDQNCASGKEGAVAAEQFAQPTRPNIVLVILDTLRADKLGCYGFGEDTSPEIDDYARQGVRFSRVIAQSSWTRPSIGAMLTGIYPRTLGLYKEKNERLAERYVTLAETLKKSGYTTIGITANPNINAIFGFDQGFDHYVNSDKIFDWMRPASADKKANPGDLLASKEVFAEALAHLDRGRGSPYFIQLNLMECHGFGAPVRPEFAHLFSGFPHGRYLRAIRQLSRDLKQFIDKLVQRPDWGRTLVAITSDHGEGLDDHPGLVGGAQHGYLLYESQVSVPLILYDTSLELPAGRVIDQPVRLIDLSPTLIDLAGSLPPGGLNGVSLRPLITQKGASPEIPSFFVVETNFRQSNKIGLYTGQWKYFENRDGWRNINPQELQKVGRKEKGRVTDEITSRPEIGREHARFLSEWEASHRKAKTTPTKALSAETTAQLKALGYID